MKPSTHYGADHLSQRKTSKGQKGYKGPAGTAKAHGNQSSNKTYYPMIGTRKHIGSKNKSGGGYSPNNNQVYLGKTKLG